VHGYRDVSSTWIAIRDGIGISVQDLVAPRKSMGVPRLRNTILLFLDEILEAEIVPKKSMGEPVLKFTRRFGIY
jgi:hypothetical protein